MGIVIAEGDARGVQVQRVTRDGAADSARDRGAGGGGGAVIGLGERATDAGGRCQRLGCDAGRCIGNGRGGEAVVRGHAVGCRCADDEGALTTGHNCVGASHMGTVVGKAHACGVQTQGIVVQPPRDGSGDCRARGGGGAVIDLGERAPDAGGGGQRFWRDDGCCIGDGGCREGVVAGQAARGGRTDGEGARTAGHHGIGGGHVGIVVGQRDTRGVQGQGVSADAACNGARERGTSRGGAVIGLGEGAADAGGGRQRLGRDAGGGRSNGGRGETVVTCHAVAGGGADREGSAAGGDGDPIGRGHVSRVVGQRDAGGVQVQAVTRNTAGDGPGDRGARGRDSSVIGFGEYAPDVGSGGERPGCDGGAQRVRNDRRGETVVARHTVAARGGDGQRTVARGGDLVGRGHVSVVVSQGDARSIQAQGIAADGAGDAAGDAGAGGGGGAIVDLGECAPDAGSRCQRLGRDGGDGVGNGGGCEAVIAGHAVDGGGVDHE